MNTAAEQPSRTVSKSDYVAKCQGEFQTELATHSFGPIQNNSVYHILRQCILYLCDY